MICLDLFCGAGGAAMGYHRAGYEVIGVDINPQPRYPFEFHQADALDVLRKGISRQVDIIHASPPCQTFTVYRNCRPHNAPRWPDLVAPTRDLLQATGLPWAIENVPGAPLVDPIQLCGTSFGIRVRRHRLFELGRVGVTAPPCDHGRFTDRIFPGSTNRPNGRTVCNVGEYRVPLAVQRACMQVDWPMTLAEISEAIPPAYTEFIGRQLVSGECGGRGCLLWHCPDCGRAPHTGHAGHDRGCRHAAS